MSQRRPLSQAEKDRIYAGKLQGKRLGQVAAEVQCSVWCARKWWRRGRDEGRQGLQAKRRGRGPGGMLSQFVPEVAAQALHYKRSHPRWGARRVRVELGRDQALQALADLRGAALPLPSASRLAAFFKASCPECVASPPPPAAPARRPPRATEAHEIWQLDSQEGIKLHDGAVVTMCNIRDEASGALIASQTVTVTTPRRWRKLKLAEVQAILRTAFAEWQTLPDALLTDNELGLAGSVNGDYPGRLSLWLIGLGITHLRIRPGCPQDQAHVERTHLTLDNFAFAQATLADQATLQHTLDEERYQYNHLFPARATGCAGRPPLVAYPELLQPRRPYHRQAELSLFRLQRVADYLATFTFERKVNRSGQISLGRQCYSVGRPHAGQTVVARFDPDDWLWLVYQYPDAPAPTDPTPSGPQDTQTAADALILLTRRPPKTFSREAITGLDPQACQPPQPVQLTFPWLVA